MKKYWMVHNAESGPANKRHGCLETARAEAQRLARENPGLEFFVLETIASCKKVDVEWADLRAFRPDDELPF